MAGMAHGHAWPFQGHLVWPWKGQRVPQIDAKRRLSAPDEQKQKNRDGFGVRRLLGTGQCR